MEYSSTVTLKDGRACILRNGTASDGQALRDIFNLTHTQTDYLLTYPEELSYTSEDEAELLRRKTDSVDEIESCRMRRNQLCRTQRKDQASCRIWHQCG